LNRTLHYAVPAFLMMTALVLTTALLRQFRVQRYTTNRALAGAAALPALEWGLLGVSVLCVWRVA
jgi:hypothetical protein